MVANLEGARDAAEAFRAKHITGSLFDRYPNRRADKPVGIEVDHHQQQNVDRPDAQGAAGVEVMEVFGLVAGGEQVAGDQEAAHGEEERDAGPAPQGSAVNPGSS